MKKVKKSETIFFPPITKTTGLNFGLNLGRILDMELWCCRATKNICPQIKSNYLLKQECHFKNYYSAILCIACIPQELRKIQKWQKSKTLWGYNVSPSWHFLYELEKDGSLKNISSRTYYAPASCLLNKLKNQAKRVKVSTSNWLFELKKLLSWSGVWPLWLPSMPTWGLAQKPIVP